MAWSRKKVNSETLNNGNEYTKNNQFPIEALNGIVNSGLYSQDFVEHLADTPDVSEAGNVGTPTVTLVDNPNATTDKPYKRFKFANLKGAKGDKGDKGEQGEKGEKGDIGVSNSLSIGTVQSGEIASAEILGTAPSQVLNLVLPKGDKGDAGAASVQINRKSSQEFSSLSEFRKFMLQKKFENKFINLELWNTTSFTSPGSDKIYSRLVTIKSSGVTFTENPGLATYLPAGKHVFYPIKMNPGENGEYINGSQIFEMMCNNYVLKFEDSNKINLFLSQGGSLASDSFTYQQFLITITSKIVNGDMCLYAYYLD